MSSRGLHQLRSFHLLLWLSNNKKLQEDALNQRSMYGTLRSVFTEEVARSTEWMMKNAPESTTRRDVKAELLPGVTSEHEASELLENTAWESCSSKCANILVWLSCSISQSAHPEEKIHSKREKQGKRLASHFTCCVYFRSSHNPRSIQQQVHCSSFVRYCSLPVVVEEKISCKSSFVAVTQI